MRVVLPFKLIGQKLVKGRDFPKSVADGSKDSIVIKVDGIPDGCIASGYFKLSWESNTIYDLTFNGDELVVDEYIVTLPTHANNKYIDYKFSFSLAIWEGDVERLTTNPVEIVVEKSNYSGETTNTPNLPESQYDALAENLAMVTELANDLNDDVANHGRRITELEKGGGESGVICKTPTYPCAMGDAEGHVVAYINIDENGKPIVDYVGKDEAVYVYNVTVKHPLASGYYTLEAAVAAVPNNVRKSGLIVTFRSEATKWLSYQFTAALTANTYWNDTTYWQNNSQISTPETDEESGLKWCAMGDSITEGWYSWYKEDGSYGQNNVAAKSWASHVAQMKGYELDNQAKGGTGYVRANTVDGVLKNGKDIADGINFAGYDLVTIAYGVNDWKGQYVLGSMDDDVSAGGSLYSNMRYIIEKIMSDNPLCKIIVITPINCRINGTYDTNWGLGYAYPNTNDTLEDIFSAIVEVCEWYGIEYIDMTHSSVVNRRNIEQLLPDTVHPSEECHKVMALELAKKIMF